MNNISEQHDYLRNDLCQENLEHPLLSRINNWEQESIIKIQTTAQAIFNQTKDEIKSSVEKLATELYDRQQSMDYTENDINKWTEKLKTLREKLENWSTIKMEYENEPASILHLIKMYDQQDEHSLPIVQQSVPLTEELSFYPNEKFDNNNNDVLLSEEDLVATCRSKLILSS
jgi:L-lysine 2,3-aminomutase